MNWIHANSEGFDSAAQDADQVVLFLSRGEIESGNVSDALDRLLNLSDNADHVRKFEDRLTYTFAGYDDDPREIHQIPEVVTYFRLLTSHWPYWLHFVEKETDSIGRLFWLLCDVEPMPHEGPAGMVSFRIKNINDVGAALHRLFEGTNALYEANGISKAQSEAMTDKVMVALDRAMP